MLSLVILFNGALIVFIVSTMFAAGLTTAVADLRAVLRRGRLLVLVLVANLVVVPLLGLGVAEAFGLTAAASAALILVASSPGAPFGAKVAMIQRGDVLTGSVVQVLLAALGSVTFPITANALLTRAGGSGELDLPVADLLLSVAVLQLVPFGIGLAMKHWTGRTSAGWAPVTQRVSTIAFGAVLVLTSASSTCPAVRGVTHVGPLLNDPLQLPTIGTTGTTGRGITAHCDPCVVWRIIVGWRCGSASPRGGTGSARPAPCM